METSKDFLQQILEKAAGLYKHIVLPEGGDERTIEAAKKIADRKMAKLTIIGDENKISLALKSIGAKTNNIAIINPLTSGKLKDYAEQFYQLRKNKGITPDAALAAMKDEVYFGTMMVKNGEVDGLVSGAVHSTPDTVRPALQIIKSAPGIKTVSSMFYMTNSLRIILSAD